MKGRLALLCPGQGAQHPGMFDLVRTEPRAAMLLDQLKLDSQLGAPPDSVLSDSSLLFSNRIAQPLIVAAAVATWEAIRDDLPAPTLIAGYSIGELAAYCVAGSLAADDAISLAVSRASLMDACLETTPPQTLMAISGLSVQAVSEILQHHQFYRAIETGEDSFIVGGPARHLLEVQGRIVALGGRASVLPVRVASHTPYMQAAVAPFAAALRRCHLKDPDIPVLSGISAEMITRSEQAITHLSRQIAETIRWKDCMDSCAEAGVTVALELGPGSALSRMLHDRHPNIACRSVADFRSIDGVKRWLARHLD
jgi:[acyl-carrier-protein] S-malonyltransferase